jgi:hypothetical protein
MNTYLRVGLAAPLPRDLLLAARSRRFSPVCVLRTRPQRAVPRYRFQRTGQYPVAPLMNARNDSVGSVPPTDYESFR